MNSLVERMNACANSKDRKRIAEGLAPLFERACSEGLWFNANYQNIWFSPKELIEKLERGNFWWGVANWALYPPSAYLAAKQREVDAAIQELSEAQERIGRESK